MSVQLSSPDKGSPSNIGHIFESTKLFTKQQGIFRRMLVPVWGTWVLLLVAWAVFRAGGFVVGSLISTLVFVGLPGAAVLFVASAVWWRRQFDAVMDIPSIHASSDTLQPGEELTIDYRQHFKKNTEIESLRVQLVLREWVRYTQGTNTYTDTREIVMDEDWLDMQPVTKRQDFAHTFRLRVPDDAMHTWEDANDNKITWRVKVDLDMPGWVDFRESYEVVVQPEAHNATV